MKITAISILLLLTQSLTAQNKIPKAINEYAAIDKKALQIPDSLTKTTGDIANYITTDFNTDKEKVRAIFIWVATNIQYDIDNMFAINFYEKKEDKIAKPLKTRKGICGNYAELFNDICLKAHLKSYVIEGYTKQNGFADFIPHAWCAVLVNNSWLLFDPTWGSGYISNNKFYRKINEKYFHVLPALLIKSHMPFDYLWQFLNYPVTNQQFYEGKTVQNKSKPFFNYIDSIQANDNKNYIEKLISSAKRIEENGIKNSLIFDRLQHIKMEIENHRNTESVNLYNKAADLYNKAAVDYSEAINIFNEFIQYRNKQFTPGKTDAEIQNMLDKVNEKLSDARTKLDAIKNADQNLTLLIPQLNKSISDVTTPLKEQQDWLKIYFSKSKAGRKSMFYEKKKITLFGKPI
ncbi:MAG TPA: transglutaminase domain-containing protein [Chitinophagaceae bacterium]|nr:transglutaminase domain-containing protein [Chitinophagaceae bacterium]